MAENIKIGLISVSDRAAAGIYPDEGIPHLMTWLSRALCNPCQFVNHVIPDEKNLIETTLIHLVDDCACPLIFTTGGTGPALRDVTPDATLAIADRIMPGFGEQMRQLSLHFVPTAILSRQIAVIRKKTLIVNLPGRPGAIQEILEGIKTSSHQPALCGIFASIPYCIELLGGPIIETNEAVITCFRPKMQARI